MVCSGWLAQGPRFAASKPAKMLTRQCGWDTRAESVRNILCQDGRTITQLSAATRRCYGSRSPYFIPPSFLYQLRSGVTPHVCQIVALSESTGYRFVDWLRMFGFDLHQIPRLQIRLHPERTTLVTPMEDCFAPFLPQPSFDMRGVRVQHCGRGRESGTASAATCSSRSGAPTQLVVPRLLPGNIVRVDRYYAQRIQRPRSGFHESSLMAG